MRSRVLVHLVVLLVRRAQALLRQAFEADVDVAAPRPSHQARRLRRDGVDRGLRRPEPPERHQRFAQLAKVPPIGAEVVVPEIHDLPLPPGPGRRDHLDVADHVRDGPVPVRVANRRQHAERAGEWASTRSFVAHRHGERRFDELVAWGRNLREVRRMRGEIERLETAAPQIVQQRRQHGLGLAHDHGDAVGGEVFRVQGRVQAADDHGNAAAAKRPRDVACMRRAEIHRGQEHDVDIHVEIDIARHLVDDLDLPVAGQERREVNRGIRRGRAVERQVPGNCRSRCAAVPGGEVLGPPGEDHRCAHTPPPLGVRNERP